jgi:hypothetical protein
LVKKGFHVKSREAAEKRKKGKETEQEEEDWRREKLEA